MNFLHGACLENATVPSAAAYKRLQAMGARLVVTMWASGTLHGRGVYDRLEADLGKPTYVIRVGPSGKIGALELLAWANDAAKQPPKAAIDEGRVLCQILNEPNHPGEGGWSSTEYAELLAAVYPKWPLPGTVGAAGPSQGIFGWYDWYARFLAAQPPFDWQAVHYYPRAGQPIDAFWTPAKPVWVTEYGIADLVGTARAAATDVDFRALAARGALGAAQFIVAGKAGGGWDQRYAMGDDEVAELGRTVAAAPIAVRPLTQTSDPPKEESMPKVALSAGHHNHDSGDAREIALTGKLTPALAAACRDRGMDVRVVQSGDGTGTIAGGVQDVGRQVVKWSEEGWSADVFLELHGQALGDAHVRGAFAIFPDHFGDVDRDVRDKLGPDVVRRLGKALGIPPAPRGPVLSERSTQVGLDGYRLGVFSSTVSLKATCTRLILETLTYTNQADVAISARPDFDEKAAGAIADALASFLGIKTPAQPVGPDTGKLEAELWGPLYNDWSKRARDLGRGALASAIQTVVVEDKHAAGVQ